MRDSPWQNWKSTLNLQRLKLKYVPFFSPTTNVSRYSGVREGGVGFGEEGGYFMNERATPSPFRRLQGCSAWRLEPGVTSQLPWRPAVIAIDFPPFYEWSERPPGPSLAQRSLRKLTRALPSTSSATRFGSPLLSHTFGRPNFDWRSIHPRHRFG